MHDFRNFILTEFSFLTLNIEQFYSNLQVTKFKNKEVTGNLNPKVAQTLENIGISKTLNTKP